MYIFGKHIGFYSKVLGSTTKLLVSFDDLGDIEVPAPKKLVIYTLTKKKRVSNTNPIMLIITAYLYLPCFKLRCVQLYIYSLACINQQIYSQVYI
jgi:hypothetical protein